MKKEKLSYAEMLKDPRWQKRKTEILNRENFTCQLCGDTKNTLHVHHKYYLDNHKPWEYNNDALVSLCEHCHQRMYTKPNTDIVKIGDVYLYCHSDFDDYLMCFDIDYIKEVIYLAGMDNGSGSDSFWVFKFSYEGFRRECRLCENFFNEGFWDDYRQQCLLSQYYYLLNEPHKLSIYDDDDGNVQFATRFNLDIIKENNEGFAHWYNAAIEDSQSIIRV